ncbi:MAG: hypothetical protein GX847_07445 [Clostridiales bacterium]|nr:hypothetical protein [Clostridiales bacterium]
MSSTIYYKGTLKDSSSIDDLYDAVLRQSAGMNCRIVREEDSFYFEFTEGTSEPLVFRIQNGKINWFCKWDNPGSPEEYYKIFDLFMAIKPFFKSLRIDDDEGAWREYQLKMKPCKIRLRELSGTMETCLLKRDFNTARYDLSEFMKPGMTLLPYSDAVYCVIAQDFLKILKADSVAELDRDRIIELANRVQIEEDGPFTPESFEFRFPFMLILIWIGHCLTYGSKGRVYQLSDETWGLKTNKLAAEFGLLSVFLNIHCGTVNYKHAEMKRFAADHVYTGPKSGEFSDQARQALSKLIRDYVIQNNIDTTAKEPVLIPVTGNFKEAYEAIFAAENKPVPEVKPGDIRQSLQALVSILDYLGFKYVGAEV